MSDYSSGIMIHATHKEIAKKYMEDSTYLIKLNDMWLCRLSEDVFCRQMDMDDYSESVLNLSMKIPLMHVMNAEEDNFELGILHNKELIFHVNIDYSIISEFAFNIGYEIYGDYYMELIFDPKVVARVQNEIRRRYHWIDKKMESLFSEVHTNDFTQFKLFGFNVNDCTNLASILTATNYKKDKNGHEMIKEFLSILNLSEFSFVSHEYVKSDERSYDIVEYGK